jgi:molecular chaperone GrpE
MRMSGEPRGTAGDPRGTTSDGDGFDGPVGVHHVDPSDLDNFGDLDDFDFDRLLGGFGADADKRAPRPADSAPKAERPTPPPPQDPFDPFEAIANEVSPPRAPSITPRELSVEIASQRYRAATERAAGPPKTPASDSVREAEEQARALGEELTAAKGRLQRVNEDFRRFRSRAFRDTEQAVREANEGLLRAILPAIDDLNRAIENGDKGTPEQVVAGVRLVQDDLHRRLKQLGVEPIESVGANFDPTLHQAMQVVQSDESPPGTVISEWQRGYVYGGRLLRPAAVTVAAAPPAPSPPPPPAESAGPAPSAEPDVEPGATDASGASADVQASAEGLAETAPQDLSEDPIQ